MWTRRRITQIAIQPWTLVAAGLGVLPALVWAVGASFYHGAASGLLLGVGGFVVFVLLQALYGALYNRIPGLGVVLVFADKACMSVPVGPAFPALVLWAGVQGEGLALWSDLVSRPPGPGVWWQAGGIIFPLGMILAGWGTMVLYNHVVVPFYGTLSWNERAAADHVRITEVDPNQWRLILAALCFAWAAVLLLIMVLALLLALGILSRDLPAGSVSLGLAVFTGFLMAVVGFLVAIGVGWWMYLGAWLYNRWTRRGGGLVFREDAKRVVL